MSQIDIHSRLLYRDALMLVLDKPAGIPVHKGTGGGVTLDDFFEELRFGLPRLPALAHRLDRDTSGCLILGRHRQALDSLGKMFASGRIQKTYWAIVHGIPPEPQGIIDFPLARQSESGKRWYMKVVEEGGITALTEYKLLGSANGLSWLELYPKTGRTHQLRVHCAAIGCPIVSDPVYGGEAGQVGMMQLHARSIEIPLYPKKDPIIVTAPVPEHMESNLISCGYSNLR